VTQQGFEAVYQQADAISQLLNGSINNLDRQIVNRTAEKPGPRRKTR
jgi:hypothetical protein